MSDTLPRVTVIIPTRPGQGDIPGLEAARALDYPKDRLEVLVVRGRQPAIQRNAALREASGDIVYFLDDDTRPLPSNLRRALAHFENTTVAMVGGPNLCPEDAPTIEKVFAVALTSWLAFGPSRARYDKVGRVRVTSEKELILCNLLARRSAVMAAGGFDESLYPNEENALMDELVKRGARLIYDPELVAFRRPRPTFRAFCRMLLNYGRGRAEQFRLHPTMGSALNLVPPVFCLYLVAAPWFGAWALWPLVLYVLAVVGQVVLFARNHPVGHSILAGPLVILTHILYGLGFWRGLFTTLSRKEAVAAEVRIERIV